MTHQVVEPRELFGSKLGLVLGQAGKDKVRYTIIYKVKPVKEMMVRFGVCHKNNTKKHITKQGTIIMIKVNSGLFGLDQSGMLRCGQTDDLQQPMVKDPITGQEEPVLHFDGFRGIELLGHNKYRLWKPDFKANKWMPEQNWVVKRNSKIAREIHYAACLMYVGTTGKILSDDAVVKLVHDRYKVTLSPEQLIEARECARDTEQKRYTYYPFKEALLPMPKELLHDGDDILIPATEAVSWMQAWVKRQEGLDVVVDDATLTLDNMGSRTVDR